MKFNIKNWQDKYLIKESRLKKEIDFKNQDAFKKYNSKHKMRSTTKVTIGGKDTTAGDATGDKKQASASKMTPQQKEDTVYGAFEMLGDTLTRGMEYDEKMMQGDLESIKKSGMSIDDAKAELENLMGATEQEDEYGNPSWPEESKEAMYSHLEDVYAQGGSDKSITAPVNVKSLSDKISKARANSDWSNEDAIDNLDQLLQDTGAYDKEELTFEDGMKAIQDLDNYQDGDGMYNDEDEAYDAKTEMQDQLIDLFDEPEGGWTNDNRGNVKADGGSHDYSELNPIGNSKAPQLQYSDDDDDGSDEGGDREKSAKAIKTFVKDNEDAVRSYTHSVLSDNMGTSEAAVEYLGWSEEEAEDADFNVYDDVVDKFMDDPETMEEYISGKDKDGDLQAGMDQIKKEYEDDPNVYESVTPNSTRIQ